MKNWDTLGDSLCYIQSQSDNAHCYMAEFRMLLQRTRQQQYKQTVQKTENFFQCVIAVDTVDRAIPRTPRRGERGDFISRRRKGPAIFTCLRKQRFSRVYRNSTLSSLRNRSRNRNVLWRKVDSK